VGLLAEACQHHHRHFLQSILKKRSYVTLKWAESSDGYIAPSNALETNKITWISTSWSQQFAHKLRAQHSGILIGSQTFKADKPELTTRHWAGKSPERFVISTNSNLFQSVSKPKGGDFSILHIGGQLPTEQAECESCDTKTFYAKDLRAALERLYAAGFQSILVEGGSKTLQSFIEANLWDEAYVFKAVKELQSGIKAPSAFQLKEIGSSKGDRVLHALNSSF
jgi:diaminohydroxyphosphoribosylaminopyrimidine deaminase / 5-amino-6-(5-phosphoribosylamino)uracil reductase